ncbi:MAG TPA: hypothetical protein VFC09_15715 [Candidatus Dormibacteraeota bacterium]|nr:hypothetical protein [Candidatus Dormibacteraeota bacterium]
MRTPTRTKRGTSAVRRTGPKDGLLKETWAQVDRDEKRMLKAVTKVVETVPAPADVIDSALAFAVRMLKAQREALVPLLDGVTPNVSAGGTLPSAGDAVASAYGLAERVLESQRSALRGLVETVTPPLARHREKAVATAPRRRSPAARRTATGARRGTRKAA